ncbi:MAG: hypothetical protein ACREPK_10215 [Rhodanobacteraceae bacterium]
MACIPLRHHVHLLELHGENLTAENFAKSCGRPIRRAAAKLARRSSTALSTTFVDKQENANASPAYRVFLRDTINNCGKP